ncbi:hypothetical protein C8F01DRAFT_492408 [Mycena amicta]|nr:hypothetical protein C8F01DRAFT_492408 [Mycena amicta]
MSDQDVLDWDEDDAHDDDDAVSLGSVNEDEVQSEVPTVADSQPDPPISKPPSPEPPVTKPTKSPSPRRGRGERERQRSHREDRDRRPPKTALTQPITHALPPKPVTAAPVFSHSSSMEATSMASSLKDSKDAKTKPASIANGSGPPASYHANAKPSSTHRDSRENREREPPSSERDFKAKANASPPSPTPNTTSRAPANPKGTWDRPERERDRRPNTSSTCRRTRARAAHTRGWCSRPPPRTNTIFTIPLFFSYRIMFLPQQSMPAGDENAKKIDPRSARATKKGSSPLGTNPPCHIKTGITDLKMATRRTRDPPLTLPHRLTVTHTVSVVEQPPSALHPRISTDADVTRLKILTM